jgi:predicted RNA-binding Zn-ribbon protein involved in translation (DUF1610 family)
MHAIRVVRSDFQLQVAHRPPFARKGYVAANSPGQFHAAWIHPNRRGAHAPRELAEVTVVTATLQDKPNFGFSAPCSSCDYKIQPNELVLLAAQTIKCPNCGVVVDEMAIVVMRSTLSKRAAQPLPSKGENSCRPDHRISGLESGQRRFRRDSGIRYSKLQSFSRFR